MMFQVMRNLYYDTDSQRDSASDYATYSQGVVADRSRIPKITNDDAMGRTARTPATLCQDPRRLNPACEGAPDAIPHAVGARGTLSAPK